jgi:hypothetical protein
MAAGDAMPRADACSPGFKKPLVRPGRRSRAVMRIMRLERSSHQEPNFDLGIAVQHL